MPVVAAEELRRHAEELGLDVVGAAPAEPYEETERHIRERRARGLFADMRFTMAQPEVSCHPETLLEGARTVVSAALCYFAPAEPPKPGEGRLPRYTWFDAYAELREKLDALGRRLGGAYRVLVDANQHVDREGAVRGGVGFYGKNTMLITRKHGSWVVLGTLVTDVQVGPSPRLELDCGSCTLCIDACPTGALDEPGTLDATKCLSYWTQAPGPIPEEYREPLESSVYGCDICQDVCPWNGRAARSEDPAWQPRDPLRFPTLIDLCDLDDAAWRALLKGSAMRRAGLPRIRRSLAYAAAALAPESGARALDALERQPSASDDDVADAIQWARATLSEAAGRTP